MTRTRTSAPCLSLFARTTEFAPTKRRASTVIVLLASVGTRAAKPTVMVCVRWDQPVKLMGVPGGVIVQSLLKVCRSLQNFLF